MKPSVILDAGPLVAFINARDMHHAWTVEQLKKVAGPMVTCESVLSEAVFLLRHVAGGAQKVAGLLKSQGLQVAFDLRAETTPVCDHGNRGIRPLDLFLRGFNRVKQISHSIAGIHRCDIYGCCPGGHI